MKNYIALKPCRFQGVNYKIGEKISEEKISPQNNSEPEKISEEIKKSKKKSKAGDENDIQL